MFSDVFEEVLKGIRYSYEPGRVIWVDSQVIFQGNHSQHTLRSVSGEWQCDCRAWETRAAAGLDPSCRHTIALQRILTRIDDGMARVCAAERVR